MADKEYLRRNFRFIVSGLGVIVFIALIYFGDQNNLIPNITSPNYNSSPTSAASQYSTSSTSVSSGAGNLISSSAVSNSNPNPAGSTIIPIGNYGSFNILILVLILVALVLVILVSRFYRQNFKGIAILKPERKIDKIQYDSIKLNVINEYLKLSKLLEEKGINPDFSLTPIEFDSETKVKLRLSEFQTITYYYELARFSADSLSTKDIEIFEGHVKAMYDKIQHLEKIEKHLN